MADLNQLVTKVRGANPGAYDDMNDAALTRAVLAKYPQYSDLAAPAAAGPQTQVEMASPLPTENIPVVGAMLQPVGEVLANLFGDPKFRKETAKYGATSAAVAGAGALIPAAAPATAAAARVAASSGIGKVALGTALGTTTAQVLWLKGYGALHKLFK